MSKLRQPKMPLARAALAHAACVLFAFPALAQTPTMANAAFASAVADLRASRFPEAEAGFRKVAELEPANVRGQLGIAQVLMAWRKPGNAVAYLQGLAQDSPGRLDYDLALSDTAARAGRYDVSFAILRQLAKLDPGILTGLAVPRGASGGSLFPDPVADPVATAVGILTTRDLTPPGAAGIHVRLAELYRIDQDHADAIEHWQKASALAPKTSWILANLGLEQEAAGKKAEAMQTYRESLAAYPDAPLVLNNLAFLMAESGGDLFEAMRFARRAEALMPGEPNLLDTQGWIALKQGFVDDAVHTFLRVVERQPANPEFRLHLALAVTKREVHSPASDKLLKALNAPQVAGDEANLLELLKKAMPARP